MNKKFLALALIASAVFSSSASATEITLSDADGVYSYNGLAYNGPSQYTSQGYTFATMLAPGDTDGHFHQGSFGTGTVLMHDNSPGMPDIWRLTSAAGLFNLVSFTAIGNGLLWSVDGGAKQAAASGLNTINLNNVSYLDFQLNESLGGSNGMDAFEVEAASAVPEPASFALMGLGLALLAFRRRLFGR